MYCSAPFRLALVSGTTTVHLLFLFFFLNDPAPTEIYPLSLHDALPISELPVAQHSRISGLGVAMPFELWNWEADLETPPGALGQWRDFDVVAELSRRFAHWPVDRKSTRLNSSHGYISDAAFCLKKKTHS